MIPIRPGSSRQADKRHPGAPSVPGRLAACAALALAVSWPASACAQAYGQLLDSEIPLSTETGRNQGVRDRPKPELTPIGQTLGGFRLYPSVTTGLGFTNNVIGAEINPRSDVYAEFRPELLVQSQWGRHSLSATANYDGQRYFNTGPKNQNGFLTQVQGTLDVHDMSTIIGSASYRRVYEDQQQASFPAGGGGAVGVEQATALLRGTYVANRFRWTLSSDVNSLRYENTISTTGRTLDLSFRDRDVYRGSARLEYTLTKDNSVFGQVTYRRTDYLTTSITDDRTSNEWRAMGGAIADITDLLRIAGAVGYLHRAYPNPTFKSIGSLAFDVRANYYLTPLTTISAAAGRQVEEAIVVGSSGYIETRLSARVDHELLRNLILFALADHSTANFQGIDRRDRFADAGVGADYSLNRTWVLRGQAQYVTRESSGGQRGPDIDEFRASLTLKYQL